MACDVFLNYRRRDSAPYANNIHKALSAKVGADRIFMDTSSLEGGAAFPAEIDEALASARFMVVVIGLSWLTISDEFGRRRIDQADDWVRREIERALERGMRVIPVLIEGATLPPAQALPKTIVDLADRQKVELRDAFFDKDVESAFTFVKELTVFSEQPRRSAVFPSPPSYVPEKISAAGLQAAMLKLPDWDIVKSPVPGKDSAVRTELTRVFEFESFLDAIDFMRQAATHVDKVDHHPRWENLWKSVTVYLTTWDIGHNISDRDITLAGFLDRAYAEWRTPRSR